MIRQDRAAERGPLPRAPFSGMPSQQGLFPHDLRMRLRGAAEQAHAVAPEGADVVLHVMVGEVGKKLPEHRRAHKPACRHRREAPPVDPLGPGLAVPPDRIDDMTIAADPWPWQDGRRERYRVAPVHISSRLAPELVGIMAVSYTHLRAHETPEHLVC